MDTVTSIQRWFQGEPDADRVSNSASRTHHSPTSRHLTKVDNASFRELRGMVEHLTQKLERRDTEHNARVTDLQTRLRRAQDEARDSAAKVSELQKANARLKKEQTETSTLLATRTGELLEAQSFLATADDVADSEVLQIVERLNSMIFQTAASIAESPLFRRGAQDPNVVHEATLRLKGERNISKILTVLPSIDPTNHPILLQTLVQSVTSTYTYRLATTWNLDHLDPNRILHRVYSEVTMRESQFVAGRWRAICRAGAKAVNDPESIASSENVVQTLTRTIADVLSASNMCSASSSTVHDTIQETYGSSIKEITMLALKIQEITGDDILSRDLRVHRVQRHTPFSPVVMTDEWADPKGRESPEGEARVLCTTQLGLRRREIKDGRFYDTLLLKPKVMLEGTLQRLL